MAKIILFNLLLLTCFLQRANSQNAGIIIDTNHIPTLKKVQRLFGITMDCRTGLLGSGSNGYIGYFDTTGQMIPEVKNIFHDFPLGGIRYPGNGIGVGFDWKKSIGPKHTRINQDLLGGIGSPQKMNFGFDEFMDWVISKGLDPAEVQIMVPIYDSSDVGLTTAQSRAKIANVLKNNADWVEYCNAPNDGKNVGGGIDWAAVRAANGHPQPYGIKYWNIGNEPWSVHEYGPTKAGCQSYLTLVTPMIDSMLSRDSTLKITLPISGNPNQVNGWAYTMLYSSLIASGKIYGLSQHYFPTESTVAQSIQSVENALTSLVTLASQKKVNVFVGDYAHYIFSTNPSQAQQDSAMQWMAAILEADMLLMLSQKPDIERANFWTYGNALATWHPIRKNAVSNYSLLPAATLYKELYPVFLDYSVNSKSNSPAASDGKSYTVRANVFLSNDSNRLNVIAVNRDPINAQVFTISGTNGYSAGTGKILYANSPTSEFVLTKAILPDSQGNFLLPPMSVFIRSYSKTMNNPIQNVPQLENVGVFPNPAHERIYFSRPLEYCRVYSISGLEVLSVVGKISELEIHQIPNGLYIIESNWGREKLIVAHP